MKILHANTAGSLPAKVETLEAATTRWLARWSVTMGINVPAKLSKPLRMSTLSTLNLFP
jgi:hypothetical protein